MKHLAWRISVVMLIAVVMVAGYISFSPTTVAAGTSYYVDCWSGNDIWSGTGESQAWKSLSRANNAPLAPGDQLLLRRGCTWTGPLKITRSGTSTAPILISAYGSGTLPIIQNASSENVIVSGSWVILEYLHARSDAPGRDASCQNQAIGWRSGFRFNSPGANNIVRFSKATELAVGVFVAKGSHHNQILNNAIIDNTMMAVLDGTSYNDSGAFGVLLHGDDNEVAYNEISGHDACSYDYGRDGAAIEVYGGQRNHIHHNRAHNNDAFSELGVSGTADNTYAYNQVTSTLPNSTFVVTRGANESWGPVYRTRLYNNTVHLTGSNSQGFVCHAGCNSSILIMRNNVIQAVAKAGYADAPFDGDYNLYWGGKRQFQLGPNDVEADPLFVGGGDYRLQSTSKGIDSGTPLSYTTDLDGIAVPSGGAPDRGGYEAGTTASSPSFVLANNSFNGTGSTWLSPWVFMVRNGAQATITQDWQTARIDVGRNTSQSWDVQLMQSPLVLETNKAYTVTFWAKAISPRSLEVVVQQNGSPYTVYGTSGISLTTVWQAYTFTVTTSQSVADAFVGFNLGSSPGTVWIDDVTVIAN